MKGDYDYEEKIIRGYDGVYVDACTGSLREYREQCGGIYDFGAEYNGNAGSRNREWSGNRGKHSTGSIENFDSYEVMYLGYPNMEQGFEGVLEAGFHLCSYTRLML